MVYVVGAVALVPFINVSAINNDLDAWFSRDDPLYQDYARFRAEFGGTQPLIIAVRVESPAPEAPDAGIFTRERLAVIQELTADIVRIPSVERVHSLATAHVLRAQETSRADDPQATDSGVDFQPLIDPTRRSPLEIRALALTDPFLRDELVSANGNITALVVTFDEDRLDQQRAAILDEIYRTVRTRLPQGLTAYYNGSIEINETYNRVTVDNQRRFIPPILLLTIVAVYVLFRSMAHALVVLLSILVSVIWTLGMYSLLGFGFNILSAMLAPLIVVLAISDDVHVIQHYELARRRASAEMAFVDAVSFSLKPLAASSGTTALGLLALATSDILAVRQFGIGAAIGVMLDFAISIVLVPTMLGWGRWPATAWQAHRWTAPARAAALFSTRRPVLVLTVAFLFALVAAVGIARLRVDTNHIRFFAPTHPLSRSADVIDRELAGVYNFQVLLEGAADSINSPDVLTRMDRLSSGLRALPNVRKVTSVVDHVKQTHRELRKDAADASAVPGDQFVLAQELLLFSFSDEGRRELDRLVASDYSRAQIIVRMPSMGSDLVVSTMEHAQQLAAAAFAGTNVTATVTGSGRLFAGLDHYLVQSQLSSFATAFLTIFAVMFLIFRSARFGALAVVSNLYPVVVVLGVMGWWGISINVATVMVAAIALGIVDDDTIHFLHRFRYELAHGATIDEAAESAGAIEGGAALVTAVASSCGFAVLLLSEYRPSGWFGALLALTLGVGFIAEVFLLPAIVKSCGRLIAIDIGRQAR